MGAAALIEFEPTSLEMRFWEALALIVAACLLVPMFRRLGLGTVLGYLASGVAVASFLTLSFSDHPEDLLHFAEFGVVLFLFIIGLELKPARLWEMRGVIFGLGACQVALCGFVLAVPPLLFGLGWQASMVIGLGLALSSTALVMQRLDERGERGSKHGQASFSILLFQDLAIVPLLLLVELLAPASGEIGFKESLISVAIGIGAIAILVIVGRYMLDPIFRLLAQARMPEIMTASALGVVIAAAMLMDLAGMSYAMGAFIAGVMLAESSYRHEVEANIEPFRGLFLGLFFMAVGISLDLGVVVENWLIILAAVPILMLLKGVAIYTVSRLFRGGHNTAVLTSLALPQHGEFGFVLFSAASSAMLFDAQTASILVAVVTFSMAFSPLVERLAPYLLHKKTGDTIDEDFSDAGGDVLVIGFGRFGQVVSQALLSQDLRVTIIDNDPIRVREAGRFGVRIHFGNGTRRDVLRASGAARAKLIIVCIDDHARTDAIVRLVQAKFPQARLLVRAYDRIHAIQLMDMGVQDYVRETFESAISLAAKSLGALGYTEQECSDIIGTIRDMDRERLHEQALMVQGADGRAEAIRKIMPEPLIKRLKRAIT